MASVIRLLYVDDESDLLDLGKLYLEKNGNFSVTTVGSATAALALLKREPFDAIVSDYQMPGMDGILFLVEVRAQFAQIPFILFTGRGREEVVIQAINSGADFYIRKGGDPDAQFAELAHKIRLAVSRRTNGMPFCEEVNHFPGYRGSDSDITEHKQAEEIRTRFGRVLESSLNEIYFFDAQSLRFVDVNHGARENIGYSLDELRSMTPLDIITEYTTESFEALITPLRTGEKEIQVIFTVHKRKDGSLYPAETHLQLAGEEVSPVFVAFVLDITERTQTEEALRQANWKLNLLSGITRHDINNQMAVLRGYMALLEPMLTDPALNVYIQKMDASAQRISSMIQFTKEYDEIGITVPAWQDIRGQVTTAASEVSFGTIQLRNDLPEGMEVFSEPLIFKVFYNLMDNAVRYGETITTIRFFIEDRSGDRIIVCQDDGVGVPADEKEKIFLRGFGKNTGLGLALSQEILEITGISIEETGEPGKGARFEMTVPKGMWRMRRSS
ncbi:MAG: PAS domain S-box protein [Methanoregula sp.]|nr:PAS domain S-box protein [Methanoregula sp.]